VLTVLSILGVLAVLFAAAAVATREGPILAEAPADIADVVLPPGPLQPEDLHSIRFGLAIRGYRMDEVDRVLERAAAEIGERDARIAELLHAAVAKPAVEEAPAASEPARSAPSVSPAAITHVGAASESLVPAMPHDSAEALDSIEDEPVEDEPADPEPVAAAEPDGPAEGDEPVASLLADSDEPGPIVPIEPPLDSPPPPPAEPDESPVEPPTGPPVEVAVVPLETAPLPSSVTLDKPPTGDEDDPPRD
jgi:DivIVA domain-containing protein